MRPVKLSIVIPAYNEERTLPAILERIRFLNLGNVQKEIILVDDHSTDRTQDIMKKMNDANIKIFFHSTNRGKGAAVRTGLKHATGDFIIIQDADMEYDPGDYRKLLKPLAEGKADAAFGSRFIKKSGAKRNLFYYGNRGVSFFASLLFMRRLTDIETCYKMMSRKVVDTLLPLLDSEGFELEAELTARIIRNRFRLVEVPISYAPRLVREGKKIRYRDGIKAVFYLIKYRFAG